MGLPAPRPDDDALAIREGLGQLAQSLGEIAPVLRAELRRQVERAADGAVIGFRDPILAMRLMQGAAQIVVNFGALQALHDATAPGYVLRISVPDRLRDPDVIDIAPAEDDADRAAG